MSQLHDHHLCLPTGLVPDGWLPILVCHCRSTTLNPEGNTVPLDWCMTIGVAGTQTNGYDVATSDEDWPNAAYNVPPYAMVWVK